MNSLIDSELVLRDKRFFYRCPPNLKLFILSGADQNELKYLIENKKIEKFFDYVRWGPFNQNRSY